MTDHFLAGADASAFPHPSGSVAFTPKDDVMLNAAFAIASLLAWAEHLERDK